MLSVIVLFLIPAAGLGIWLLIQYLQSKTTTWKLQAGHGASALVTAGGILIWLLGRSSWTTTFYEELTATGIVLAILVGFLLGLIRISRTKMPLKLLLLHVFAALIGISSFFWVLLT